MPKPTKIFVCSKCDAQFPKWEGRCRECGAWETLNEQTTAQSHKPSTTKPTIIDFSSIEASAAAARQPTGITEFDRVLGGGLVAGALMLLGGDPGVGKSTLLLEVARERAIKDNSRSALYVSGEESAEQVKIRLDRLALASKYAPTNLKFLGEPTVLAIESAVYDLRPALVIIDSLQTLRDESGLPTTKPSEARAAVEKLMALAKQTNTPIIIIGHVTKSGAVAGPKVLEHLVDVVLYFEMAADGSYRILRAAKNRFGSIAEVGVFHMTNQGLQEVSNPSAIFLSDHRAQAPGAALAAILEGSRIFLIEIQALVTKTRFGYPQRRSTGFPLNRLQQLLAVLNKRLNLPLNYYDVHLNVVGGLTADEPAADLAVCLAIISALKNKTLPESLITIGEVGLQGEVRNVAALEQRLEEAARLGFKSALIPKQKISTIAMPEIMAIDSLTEALDFIF